MPRKTAVNFLERVLKGYAFDELLVGLICINRKKGRF